MDVKFFVLNNKNLIKGNKSCFQFFVKRSDFFRIKIHTHRVFKENFSLFFHQF